MKNTCMKSKKIVINSDSRWSVDIIFEEYKCWRQYWKDSANHCTKWWVQNGYAQLCPICDRYWIQQNVLPKLNPIELLELEE